MRGLICVLFFLPGWMFSQTRICDIKTDSVLNVWYRNYKMNYVQGEKWKAAALGQQILRKCPEWKPELYREIGFLYQDMLDTIRDIDLKIRMRDTLYHLYHRAALHTGDSSVWFLMRGIAALKYEDQSDSILAMMLEPALRLQPMKAPPAMYEDFFRILDWKTRRGSIDSTELELWYQKLNTRLEKQLLIRDSLRDKEQILKAQKSMAYRMRRYFPDSTSLKTEVHKLKSGNYADWLKIYYRLYAWNVQDSALLKIVLAGLTQTKQEIIWALKTSFSDTDKPEFWSGYISAEKESTLKAWMMIQASKCPGEQTQSGWQMLMNASDIAPDYAAVDMEKARFLVAKAERCETAEERLKLKSLARTYYYAASQKDFRFREQVKAEIRNLPEPPHPDVASGKEISLRCPEYFRISPP